MMRPMLRRCYECQSPIGRKDIFCPRCGARQRPERMRPRAARAQSQRPHA